MELPMEEKISIGSLENTLRPFCDGIGKSAETEHRANAQMRKSESLGEHSVRYLAQGVEALNHCIEHDD